MLGGYGDFMYQTGMIDEQQRDYVDQQTSLGTKLIQQKKWLEAFEVNSYLIASTALVLDLFFSQQLFCLTKFFKSLTMFVAAKSFDSMCRILSIFFLVSGL